MRSRYPEVPGVDLYGSEYHDVPHSTLSAYYIIINFIKQIIASVKIYPRAILSTPGRCSEQYPKPPQKGYLLTEALKCPRAAELDPWYLYGGIFFDMGCVALLVDGPCSPPHTGCPRLAS